MPDSSNAYTVVISDLRRQRDEIDRMIAKLEALAGGKPLDVASAPNEHPREREPADPQRGAAVGENPFLGMKIIDAAKIVLAQSRKPMSPADIMNALEAGGLSVASANVIGSVLNRRSRDVGDVVNPKRGLWGLKEWYPGRSFAKKPSDGSDKRERSSDEASQPIEPERRDEQPRIVPLRSSDQP